MGDDLKVILFLFVSIGNPREFQPHEVRTKWYKQKARPSVRSIQAFNVKSAE